ncbi:MAG: SUMF1/EgtB/PvdO family nonheme iron enzyme [Verrucomicrobiota bacterium]|nr:SUMF1/EgtB/PvdO family nonheme iron enzyme [Verrucomicrobiota bacterium]
MLRILIILITALTVSHGAVDFERDVQPLLEKHCLKCHREDYKKSDYKIETRSAALADDIIIPGNADESIFIELIELDDDDPEVMPPAKEVRMTIEEKKVLKDWVNEGAKWDEKIVLKMPTTIDFKRDIDPILKKLGKNEIEKLKKWIKSGAVWPKENSELTKKLHSKITSSTQVKLESEMKDYSTKIPESGAEYHMIAVPGGEFKMGSNEKERGRQKSEGPLREVKISPFWIGKHEVTWNEYEKFMIDGGRRNKDGTKQFPSPDDSDVDLISRPTKPYVEMTFGMGKDDYPAISMTQHAALQYCKWLSAQTGHFYRLPTEAEWEYACRAGTETMYSFGNKENDLHKYGWFIDNSNFKYQKVGKKLPNPWGIHDMHGNVAEWTMDILSQKGYDPKQTLDPWARGNDLYPRAVRGGSWNDFPDALRSAARLGSSKSWKVQDPQLPKSIWYHTDTQWLGFRIVRPLKIPSVEDMDLIWETGIDHDTLE